MLWPPKVVLAQSEPWLRAGARGLRQPHGNPEPSQQQPVTQSLLLPQCSGVQFYGSVGLCQGLRPGARELRQLYEEPRLYDRQELSLLKGSQGSGQGQGNRDSLMGTQSHPSDSQRLGLYYLLREVL